MIRRHLVVLVALLPAAPARADQIAAGQVTRVIEGEIYINLGSGRGLAVGAPVRLKRPVRLKHPV
ncbi:MAG TPA: hypothetical protein VFU21_24405, partial [Kofleriaceae bacterium]|nr:hypothetical protein [Kofleriaceae bacterium]